MEIKDLVKAEKEIRKWAGEKAKIELRYAGLGVDDEPYLRVSRGTGFSCLVNIDTPSNPFGLYFDKREDQIEFIKWMFKNVKN